MAQNNGLSQWGEQDGAYEQRVVGGFDGSVTLLKEATSDLLLRSTTPIPS